VRTLDEQFTLDQKVFQNLELKGLLDTKALVMKDYEARSQQENYWIKLFLRVKHAKVF